MCSCHSILECGVMFSGVKLSMGSFVLFLLCHHLRHKALLKKRPHELPISARHLLAQASRVRSRRTLFKTNKAKPET